MLPLATLRRFDLAALAVFMMFPALVPEAGSAQEPTSSVITGTVLLPSGEPAVGAVVQVLGTHRRVATDAQGLFRIEGLPAGRYIVQVGEHARGHAMESVRLSAGEVLELTLVIAPMYLGDEIVVSVGPEARDRSRLAQVAHVLTGPRLRDRVGSTLGETLAGEPGMTSTYFGPGSSRPVIRGLTGDRVRVLENGLDMADTSDGGPDHAVASEAALAERIEIIRGPATLLYGGSAIGGVVNVVDDRIPSGRRESPLSGTLQVEGGSVADDLNLAGQARGSVGSLSWHVEGLHRSTNDYRIPRERVAETGHAHDSEHSHEDESTGGILENSAVETFHGAMGLSYVTPSGHLGVSWSGYRSEYGVPGHSHAALESEGRGHDDEDNHGHGEEGVIVDLERWSVDLEGVRRFTQGLVRSVRVRAGYSERVDLELEGGRIGTDKRNERWELRAEAAHGRWGPVSGVWGLQFGGRDFGAEGLEVFVPPTSTDSRALFALERVQLLEDLEVEVGLRYEERDVKNRSDGSRVRNSGTSLSAGGSWAVRPGLVLALSGSRSVKLPSPEELFSNGPHLATHQFEIGRPDLERERGLSLDLTARAHRGPFRGEVTAFIQEFDGFIFLESTAEERVGLPVLVYEQADARFRGVEARGELMVPMAPGREGAVEVGLDVVQADLTELNRPLPRIPPLQVLAALRYEQGPFRSRVALRHVGRQDRVGVFEDSTPGYRLLDASLGYVLVSGRTTHELLLRGTNLTDQLARSHVSLLKDKAPLPGRDIRLTYRIAF